MKVAIFALLAFIAISTTQAALKDDFKDIADLVPKSKIITVAGKHALLDKEFKKFRKFLKSSEFSSVWSTIIANEKFRAVVEYTKKAGADLPKTLNKIANKYNLQQYPEALAARTIIEPRSVKSFINDVMDALPKSKMSALMKEKMQTSPEFKQFIDTLSTDEFRQLVNEMRADPQLSGPFEVLHHRGLKIDQVINVAFDLLSWAH